VINNRTQVETASYCHISRDNKQEVVTHTIPS